MSDPFAPPFASVIIPSFRRPRELRRALLSLAAQGDPAWEALVADDGDGEAIIASAALGDRRVRAFQSPGRGQVDARNAAITLARGEYVCWLDDDDWWDDAAHLGQLRAAAAERPCVLYRGGWFVHPGGQREPFDLTATLASLRSDNCVLTSSIAYPREAHRQIGLLDPSLGGYCDWDVLLRLTDAGLPLRKIPGPAVCYSIHEGSVSSDPTEARCVAHFERLREKHRLNAVVKNHLSLARERQPAAALGARGEAPLELGSR